jgi:hypothetical protein
MTDSVITDRKQKKRARDMARDQGQKDELWERYQELQDEDSEILLSLKRHAGTNTLGKELLINCANALSVLSGITSPGRQEKRLRRFIIGWMNENANVLLPHITHIVIRDNRGGYQGSEEVVDDLKTWERENDNNPELINTLRYLERSI